MNATATRAMKAYQQVGVETGVAAANPVRLIVMLYDGALAAIREAQGHLSQRRLAEKGQAISRAIDIIEGGLNSSLDTNRGGQLASQLNNLYEYMGRRLLMASMRNEAKGLDEVAQLLSELKTAWEEISRLPLPESTLGKKL